jgi:lactate permease
MYLAFHQVYQPVAGSVIASALVALAPLLLLFVLLAVLRLAAWIAALAALACAFLLAWLVWGMGFPLTLSAATEGMAFGLWPISWVVLNAVFFHNLTVASGNFDVIRRSLARLTEDRRIQALGRGSYGVLSSLCCPFRSRSRWISWSAWYGSVSASSVRGAARPAVM